MSDPLIGVVEDDDAVRGSIVLLLENNGFRVQAYESAELFLAYADLAGFEGLILDVRLPGMSGLELLEQVTHRRLPTIVITGHEDRSSFAEVISEGRVHFLSKPFDPLNFLKVLMNALGHSSDMRR